MRLLNDVALRYELFKQGRLLQILGYGVLSNIFMGVCSHYGL